MTSPHEESVNTLVELSEGTFANMQTVALEEFGKEVPELKFEEAARLIGAVLVASAQESGAGKGKINGETVIDASTDGADAFVDFARNMAEGIIPKANTSHEIVLNVVRDQAASESIHPDEPIVLQTINFRNEPSQIA